MAKTKTIEIKTIEDLSNHLSEFHQEFEDLKGQVIALESEKDQYTEKIKSLTILTKGNFNKPVLPGQDEHWNDDKANKFGEFIKAVARKDNATIEKMGGAAISLSDEPSNKGDLGIPNMKDYSTIEDKEGLSGGLSGKAASGTPLTGDAVTGSYLVPNEYLTEVVRTAYGISEIMALVNTIKMSTRVAYYPKTLVEPEFTYVSADAEDLTEGTFTFAQATLTAYTYALWLGFTEAMFEDTNIGIGTLLKTVIAEAWAKKFDSELFTGTGSPVTGLLADTSVNAVTMGAGDSTFGSINPEYLMDLIEGLDTRGKRRGAYFMFHPTIIDMIMNLRDANGQYLWRADMGAGKAPTLHGYPYLQSDELPDSGDDAESTPFCVFGNPRNIAFGDRIALELKFFDQTEKAVTNTQVFWRARVRAALDISLPANFTRLVTAAS